MGAVNRFNPMSLWPHLNQMDKIKNVFLKHHDLFEGCGFAIVGSTIEPTMYLGANIPQEKRKEFAAKFQFINWKRERGYGNHYTYRGHYDGVEFKLDDAEAVPSLPKVNEIVVFEESQEKQSA